VIYYLILPLFCLLLIVVQTAISDILFFGKIGIEISLVVTIYAGFRLDVLRGGLLCLSLGFLLDCMSGSISGFYTLIYILIYFVSMLASQRVVPDKLIFIGFFSLLCVLFEALMILVMHPLIYEGDIFRHVVNTSIPQALVIGIISPAVFTTFRRVEIVLGGRNAYPIK